MTIDRLIPSGMETDPRAVAQASDRRRAADDELRRTVAW